MSPAFLCMFPFLVPHVLGFFPMDFWFFPLFLYYGLVSWILLVALLVASHFVTRFLDFWSLDHWTLDFFVFLRLCVSFSVRSLI